MALVEAGQKTYNILSIFSDQGFHLHTDKTNLIITRIYFKVPLISNFFIVLFGRTFKMIE